MLAAKVGGAGVEFVVPEVVIWEWAEHAHAAVAAVRDHRREVKVDPTLVALPPDPPPMPAIDMAVAIAKLLPSAYMVWSPSGTDYEEAVRAQVLQLGASERKEGVKTGAADHLVFRCVHHQVGERLATEAVILATSDKRLLAFCEAEFGADVLVARDDRELLSQLLKFEPAEEDLIEAVEGELHDRVNTPGTDLAEALGRFAMGVEVVSRLTPPSAWEEERFSLRRAEILELHTLDLAEPRADELRIGSALIRIFGPVLVQVFTFEPIGDEDFEKLPSYESVGSASVDLPITITFERDWTIRSAEPAGEATVDFGP